MADQGADEGTAVYRVARRLGGPLLARYVRLRVQGAERVPASGGVVLAANHESYLDPLVLAVACPRPVAFVMLRRFAEMPVLGWFCRAAGSFPIDEGRMGSAALRRSLAVVGDGGVLGIFPEGGITPDGRLRPGRPGVARIALRSGAPIVPAGIVGTRRSYPKGRIFPRRSGVVVRFGEPIPTGDPAEAGEREREAALAALVMERIAALRDGG